MISQVLCLWPTRVQLKVIANEMVRCKCRNVICSAKLDDRIGALVELELSGSAFKACFRSTLMGVVAASLVLLLVACSHLSEAKRPVPDKNPARTQLSIGYSLLYHEADGIPKLKWILMFKEKPEEMGRLTHELLDYYQQLADTLRRLSTQYPAMRIDVQPMSEIEADERKAIGSDLAKDLAPVVGKSGTDFEREALLMFYNALNEQRHLVGVMIERETAPGLRKFLETTKAELDAHHAKVGALLNRRYFTH